MLQLMVDLLGAATVARRARRAYDENDPGAVPPARGQTERRSEAPMGKSLAERFAEKVRSEVVSGCLMWTGNMGGDGDAYGRIRVDGRLMLAQVVGFWLREGRMPDKKLARTCATPSCVLHWVESGTARVKPCRKCGSTDRLPPRPGAPLGNCRACHASRETARYHADPIARRMADRERLNARFSTPRAAAAPTSAVVTRSTSGPLTSTTITRRSASAASSARTATSRRDD
jgi:hypothetical protein